MTIRIIVADDQVLVRAGFAAILSHSPEFEVVGEYSDGVQAVRAARELRPDVALLDIRMPRLDGLEATRQIQQSGLPTKVIIITTFDSDEYVLTAIRNGASGFLLKDARPDLLNEAVRAVASGDALVSPAITVRLLANLAGSQQPGWSPGRSASADILTEREIELVRALADGASNAELSRELQISLGTVKSHLANIQSKLAARNRVQIASWAWSVGLMHQR